MRLLLTLAFALFSCTPAAPPERTAQAPAKPESSPKPPPAAPKKIEPPPPPPALAYDLEKDVAERKAQARDHLGENPHLAVVHDVFVVASPAGTNRYEFAGTLGIVERALDAYFNNRFRTPPARAISVYLFPSAKSYDNHCNTLYDGGCRSPYGIYLASSRRIVMNIGLGVGTLTHELVHPLVEADFPDAPDWLNEGIASLFEQFYFPKKGEISGGKNWRHPRLMQALGSKREREIASLPALFAMDDATFRGDLEDLNYATARYFCQWMDQNKWLWSFYQKWRDSHAQDPSGERAFESVTGMSLEEANAKWARWVRAL